jgi:Protein of unknown function (DUF1360)
MGDFTIESLFIIGLASFRLTRVIVFDKIAEFIRAPFLEEIIEGDEVYTIPKKGPIRSWIGELLSCYWCTGVWVSIGLLAVYTYLPSIGVAIILIFAVAAIASIIETIIGRLLGD